jgi:hypothetical protein
MTTAPQDQSVSAEALGTLILENTPYRYDPKGGDPTLLTVKQAREAGEYAPAAQMLSDKPDEIYANVDGPARNNSQDKGNPLSKEQEDAMRADPTGSLWWYFGGKFYRVTKTLKIPYQVKQDGKADPVTKHILVGYMGIDGGGG